MDLRVIEYFLAVAEEGNISHAAELLHVSQPTISRQLMDLEEELGKKLFLRTNKRVVLTEEGILFRETARDMILLYEKARSGHAGEKELSGQINVVAAEIESFDFLAKQMTAFHEKHPGVTFHINSLNAEDACAAIDRGTADLGLILKSVSTMKYEIIDPGISEQWGILVRRDHPLAKKESVTIRDLKKEKLVIPGNNYFRNDIREWFGDDCEIAATYTLVKNAMIMAELSDLVLICLEMNHYKNENLVFIPLKPERKSSVFFVYKKQAVLSPAVRAFISQIEMQKLNR
jgi:DNA-binding transcriptional LysR family regulator